MTERERMALDPIADDPEIGRWLAAFADLHQVHGREEIDVSADWVVFHLIDHEVEHRVRLSRLRDLFH